MLAATYFFMNADRYYLLQSPTIRAAAIIALFKGLSSELSRNCGTFQKVAWSKS